MPLRSIAVQDRSISFWRRHYLLATNIMQLEILVPSSADSSIPYLAEDSRWLIPFSSHLSSAFLPGRVVMLPSFSQADASIPL
jgi:hypothetical protein